MSECDRRFTADDPMLNQIELFDIAYEKFMDLTNLEYFANCYSNHIDDVVLSSHVMTPKAYVASLAESSVNTIQILKQ